MDKINIAVLGPGKIARRFVNGKSEYVNYYAVCGRNPDKTKKFAEDNGIDIYYSIEECLNDDNVDAVYISTPNPTHYELTKLCLNHHKHVLCEKPFVGTKEECNELYDLAKDKGLMLMEADKQLFLPLTQKIKEILDNKIIGDVKYMNGYYCDNRESKDIFQKDHWVFEEKTGGAIRDIGIYPIAYFNYLNNWEIEEVNTVSRYLHGVDCFSITEIRYKNGVFSTSVSGFDIDLPKGCDIYGTLGHIHIDNFWKTGKASIYLNTSETIELNEEMISDFKYETDHFALCIKKSLNESPVIGRNESLKLIDIFESAKKHKSTD
ncbi:MAG: Gfo/Idh/MocA family oxidoreductase [Erysipelotrichaceae bacterium]|nr:Gfo/Idh/MocA family oxidoreductase [Erysipelotrichaceae bacterium]